MGSDRSESFVCLRKRVDSKTAVNGDETSDGKHANTPVLQFGLSKEVNRNEVGESERIKSGITGVSRKIRRVFKERKSCAGDVCRASFLFNSFLSFRSGIGSDGSGNTSFKLKNKYNQLSRMRENVFVLFI